jgi:hypothetical protein
MQAMTKESAWTPRPFWVFIQALKKELGDEPPYFEQKARVKEFIKLYLYDVGTPDWERIFPWDAYREQSKE